MNVYDFDETIYLHDSSIEFYKYNLKRNPKLIKYWPRQSKAALDYKRGKITKTEMKTIFYEYFQSIENIDQVVLDFWSEHEDKIRPWYLKQKREDDVIVSASPEFFLKPICDRLGVFLIASDVDKYTGKNYKENCYGVEKVRRFKEYFNLNEIESFYSDSYSDDPLAQYATQAFMVKRDDIKPWWKKREYL